MTAPAYESTRFQLSESDVVAANKAHHRAQFVGPDKPWMIWAAAALVVFLLLLSGWLALLGKPATLVKTVVVVAMLATIVVAFDRWVLPRMARRHFRTVAAFLRETQFSWDSDGFQLRSERESADIPWGEVTTARKTTEAVLLYRSAQMHHVIPLRALAEGEADAIMAAAASRRAIHG